MQENSLAISSKLITWYLQNKRDLPWRKTREPYNIWLSEVMLQQTKVMQGLPYYLSFIHTFPSVHDLANATEDDVLKLWQGLGYYSRARNLHHTAKYISLEKEGVFPNTYEELVKLKGIGDYTASAIGSISFDLPNAVVDGNVYRVLGRIFGIETPTNSSLGIKEFKTLAQELLDISQPGTYNQAIMEFGATVCTPKQPLCHDCIFNTICIAKSNNTVHLLPVKIKAKPVKKRNFNYIVVVADNNSTMLNQRTEKGIWQQLYEFPLIETASEVSLEELLFHPEFQKIIKDIELDSLSLFNDDSIIHKLSHQHIFTKFWILQTNTIAENTIAISEIHSYAVPVLIGNFVSEFFESY